MSFQAFCVEPDQASTLYAYDKGVNLDYMSFVDFLSEFDNTIGQCNPFDTLSSQHAISYDIKSSHSNESVDFVSTDSLSSDIHDRVENYTPTLMSPRLSMIRQDHSSSGINSCLIPTEKINTDTEIILDSEFPRCEFPREITKFDKNTCQEPRMDIIEQLDIMPNILTLHDTFKQGTNRDPFKRTKFATEIQSINETANIATPIICCDERTSENDKNNMIALDQLQMKSRPESGIKDIQNIPQMSLKIGDDGFSPVKRDCKDVELQPQTIIKRSKKVFVPKEKKDAVYWARRNKNNAQSKRSRIERRIKENQMVMRASYLENCNRLLYEEMQVLKDENEQLMEENKQMKNSILKEISSLTDIM